MRDWKVQKMRKEEFNRLIKKTNPKEIIRQFYECEIRLTPSQLKKVIALKNAK